MPGRMGVVPVDARCPALGHSGGGSHPGPRSFIGRGRGLTRPRGGPSRTPSMCMPHRSRRFTVQQEVEESANPDFPELLKTIFQYIQLTHHYENWSEIPDSLNKAIDILIANIRPPLPGDGVNSKLKDPGDDFKTAILVATQAHLHSRAVNAEAELSQGRWTFVTGKRPPVRPRSTTTDV